MSADRSLAVVAAFAALLLAASAMLVRRRRGEPVLRSAALWIVLFGAAFLIARWYDTH